jgi:hypothetical protein
VNAALQCAIVEKCVGVVGATDSEYSGLAQYVLQNFSVCVGRRGGGEVWEWWVQLILNILDLLNIF